MVDVSLCLTFKNRAALLDGWFEHLLLQKFNMRRAEVCIGDGESTDGWQDVVARWHKYFGSVRTATIDRGALPFRVASNCPATDRNALVCNMPTSDRVVVTDPEVRFTDARQLANIADALESNGELMLYHRCFKLDAGGVREIKPVRFGGFCLAFCRSAFIRNGGFDERYSRGFAGEDSYFVWWWKNNSAAQEGTYPVEHCWHPSPGDDPEYQRLRREYTLPLHVSLKSRNEKPNAGNASWQRPETVVDLKTWKA